ncbi:MAG: hypothetical protein ACU0CO_03060 [Shimia sp.]
MFDFLASLSVLGWLLIALAALTLWQLPAVLRMIWHMLTTGARPRYEEFERERSKDVRGDD